jgi:hypothetical protein
MVSTYNQPFEISQSREGSKEVNIGSIFFLAEITHPCQIEIDQGVAVLDRGDVCDTFTFVEIQVLEVL